MRAPLEVLEDAISDVGHWHWWTKTDTAFQLEFAWVMLLVPSDDPSQPPSSAVALRFRNPRCVAVLQKNVQRSALPDNWFRKLGQDELKPLAVSHESFTLTSIDRLRAILGDAERRKFLVGSEPDLDHIGTEDAFLAFWAGDAGLVVVGERVEVLSHRGRIEVEEISEKHQDWWKYWRQYWDKKDSDEPLPLDDLCEITIPAGD
jgi:hypothetical protein